MAGAAQERAAADCDGSGLDGLAMDRPVWIGASRNGVRTTTRDGDGDPAGSCCSKPCHLERLTTLRPRPAGTVAALLFSTR